MKTTLADYPLFVRLGFAILSPFMLLGFTTLLIGFAFLMATIAPVLCIAYPEKITMDRNN